VVALFTISDKAKFCDNLINFIHYLFVVLLMLETA